MLKQGGGAEIERLRGEKSMKELANGLAQLAAIIMILITIAVSTAAVSQWVSAGGDDVAAQPATLADAR